VPTPVFHEKEVPMEGGFIRTRDINLWGGNERVEIHVGQFRAKNGRAPTPEQLFQIMTGKMPLEGVGESEDEFKILELAKSIGANGVRQPPIIDVDGTLLDGNRRVSACMMILADTTGLFGAEEKKRAEYIFVWQLTEHALNDDRRRVVVALNFEDDYKVKWPKYIKARKVAEEWEALLALQPRAPGPSEQRDLKRKVARKYALDVEEVTKFIKMVSWVRDFEDHLTALALVSTRSSELDDALLESALVTFATSGLVIRERCTKRRCVSTTHGRHPSTRSRLRQDGVARDDTRLRPSGGSRRPLPRRAERCRHVTNLS
jgi:hypothetical protein